MTDGTPPYSNVQPGSIVPPDVQTEYIIQKSAEEKAAIEAQQAAVAAANAVRNTSQGR